jgi:hypothetical protein
MWKPFTVGTFLAVMILGFGFFFGSIFGAVMEAPIPYLDSISKVQGILAALIALCAGVATIFGVHLQITATQRSRRDDQIAVANAVALLLDEHLKSTLFAIEYQAEHAATAPLTSQRAFILSHIQNNRLFAALASEAVKRTWDELPKCNPEARLTLARLAGLLDKFGKTCQFTCDSLEMLKDYQTSPGEMTHAQFVIHQRDRLIEVLRAEGIYDDSMEAIHEKAKERVQMYLQWQSQAAPA